jgi:hypothetical protein
MQTLRTTVVLIFALLSCTSAHAFDCSVTAKYGLMSWPVTDPRTLATFEHVMTQAGTEESERPLLCEFVTSSIGPIPNLFTLGDTRTEIILLPLVAREFSDLALKGAIAHEFGHRFEKVNVTLFRLGLKGDLEVRVDALAARWVGKEALIAALTEAKDVLGPFFPRKSRMILLKSLRARIGMLH